MIGSDEQPFLQAGALKGKLLRPSVSSRIALSDGPPSTSEGLALA